MAWFMTLRMLDACLPAFAEMSGLFQQTFDSTGCRHMVPDSSSSPQNSQPTDSVDFNNFILEIEPDPSSVKEEALQTKPESNPNLQVQFKSERGRLLLLLPPAPEKVAILCTGKI